MSQKITITSAPLMELVNLACQACEMSGAVGKSALRNVQQAAAGLQQQLDQAAEQAGELDKLKHAIVRQQEQAQAQDKEIRYLRESLDANRDLMLANEAEQEDHA